MGSFAVRLLLRLLRRRGGGVGRTRLLLLLIFGVGFETVDFSLGFFNVLRKVSVRWDRERKEKVRKGRKR